jgi:hypothetical protein
VVLRPIIQNGRSRILAGDPLQLTNKTLIIAQALAPVLALCDGTREHPSALSASLAVRLGLRIAPDAIEQLLTALDEALLLRKYAHFHPLGGRRSTRRLMDRCPADEEGTSLVSVCGIVFE